MGNVTAKTSGEIASFMTPAETNIKSLKVHFSPKQLGEGDPSPENVRNIIGWNETNIYLSNEITLFNSFSAVTGRTSGIDNNKRATTNSYGTTINRIDTDGIKTELIVTQSIADSTKERYQNGYICLFPNTDKLIIGNSYYFDADIEIISNSLNKLPEMMLTDDANNRWTITINDGKLHEAFTWKERPTVYQYPFIEFYCNGCSFKLKNMVIVPSREVKTINWTDQTGTVYGGYVDLISGELVEEIEYQKMLSTWTWKRFAPSSSGKILYTQYFANVLPTSYANIHNRTMFCNIFKPILIDNRDKSENNKTVYRGTNSYCFRYDEINTIEEWVSYINENDIYVADYLVEPITHQLTPTQLSSFIGQNNFWSNADYVEVEYELKETEDIQKVRKKIILNQPHIETKIGSESSTEVTHFKTDMKAPLKECKVYFYPEQYGSGDPSPTNIRDFVGWTEAWIGHSGVNLLYCDSPDYYINQTGSGVTSTLTRNTDGEIEAITFNGTTTSTNVFRNLNYTPDSPSEITMPSGKIALTTYSSQVYIVPMGNSNIPRTINGKAWHQSYIDALDNWTVWDVGSYENYNGLWIRAQVFPQQKDLSIDTTIYPMMCLAEDKGCKFEPYKGNDYSVDWADSVGNVYGGYVDFVSGRLVSEWGYIESYNGEAINTEWMSDRDVYAEGGVPTTGAKVIYKLSEPITYQLTPQQLVTYKGINNIWSYTNGQAEVKFWTY